jgi:hypothetical protein
MIKRGGTIDNSWPRSGDLETVELVEPESAVVDEGGLAGAGWGLPYQAEWYGKVNPWLDRIGAVYASDVCRFRGI